jgi:putative ABC transport system ATP-binding protein
MVSLKIDNVSYRYKNAEQEVLKDITCGFERGKLTAIVGPSGSGKTTLLSIMAGLDSPVVGKVLIDDEDLSEMDLDKYRRERISMIFQAFQLFPLLTALENVSYPLELSGVPKKDAHKRAKELLESVYVSDDKHKRYPSNLSGGEQQRVAIARALSTGAKVILADEPTGNLDVANSEVVIDILRNLAHEGEYCVIIVTHDIEIAEASDVVFRMKDGALHA